MAIRRQSPSTARQRNANNLFDRAQALKPGDSAAEVERDIHIAGRQLGSGHFHEKRVLDLDGDGKHDVVADTNIDGARTVSLVHPQERDKAVVLELSDAGFVRSTKAWAGFTDAAREVIEPAITQAKPALPPSNANPLLARFQMQQEFDASPSQKTSAIDAALRAGSVVPSLHDVSVQRRLQPPSPNGMAAEDRLCFDDGEFKVFLGGDHYTFNKSGTGGTCAPFKFVATDYDDGAKLKVKPDGSFWAINTYGDTYRFDPKGRRIERDNVADDASFDMEDEFGASLAVAEQPVSRPVGPAHFVDEGPFERSTVSRLTFEATEDDDKWPDERQAVSTPSSLVMPAAFGADEDDWV